MWGIQWGRFGWLLIVEHSKKKILKFFSQCFRKRKHVFLTFQTTFDFFYPNLLIFTQFWLQKIITNVDFICTYAAITDQNQITFSRETQSLVFQIPNLNSAVNPNPKSVSHSYSQISLYSNSNSQICLLTFLFYYEAYILYACLVCLNRSLRSFYVFCVFFSLSVFSDDYIIIINQINIFLGEFVFFCVWNFLSWQIQRFLG